MFSFFFITITLTFDLTLTVDIDLVTKGSLTPWNAHVKYESSIIHHSKVMANVKFFSRHKDRQTERLGRKYMPSPRCIDTGT